MNRRNIEAWALRVVDRVLAGHRVEDDLVECKSFWPSPERVARRLAAHANASRGEDILWVIGVNEDEHCLVVLDDTEPADWWAQVEKRFTDGVSPDMQMLYLTVDAGQALALHFRTDRSPYLVTVQGGAVESEVPWRSGSRTRTARRGELLSLLTESSAIPEVDFFDDALTAEERKAITKEEAYGSDEVHKADVLLSYYARVYFALPGVTRSPVMLPAHLWEGKFRLGGREAWHPANLVFIANVVRGGSSISGYTGEVAQGWGVSIRTAGLYVEGPDTVSVRMTASIPFKDRSDVRDAPLVEVEIAMPVSGSPRGVKVSRSMAWVSGEELKPSNRTNPVIGRWRVLSMDANGVTEV